MSRTRLPNIQIASASLPTDFGSFTIYGFESESGEQAAALVKGDVNERSIALVRIHSQCLTGDVLHSRRCDCREQLQTALAKIEESGCGVLVYQLQEGRGIGLINKIRAYQLQDRGVDTVEANHHLGFEADERSYKFCAAILKQLAVRRVRLMTNNPNKIQALESEGLSIEERVPLVVEASSLTERYLKTKKEKMGHLL